MEAVMRSRDGKLDRLGGLLPRGSRARRLELARSVDLIELPAGALSGVVPSPGRWRVLVLRGTVATSNPTAEHAAGAVFEHGPETALIAVTDVQLLVTDPRSDVLDQLAAPPRLTHCRVAGAVSRAVVAIE
jgi:hypothetical protein